MDVFLHTTRELIVNCTLVHTITSTNQYYLIQHAKNLKYSEILNIFTTVFVNNEVWYNLVHSCNKNNNLYFRLVWLSLMHQTIAVCSTKVKYISNILNFQILRFSVNDVQNILISVINERKNGVLFLLTMITNFCETYCIKKISNMLNR